MKGVDLIKGPAAKKSHLELILGLTLGIGAVFAVVAGLFLAYNLNYGFRMKWQVSDPSEPVTWGLAARDSKLPNFCILDQKEELHCDVDDSFKHGSFTALRGCK